MISPLIQTLQLTKVGWVEIQTTRVGHSVLVFLLFLSLCLAEKHSASVIFQFHPQYRCFLNHRRPKLTSREKANEEFMNASRVV